MRNRRLDWNTHVANIADEAIADPAAKTAALTPRYEQIFPVLDSAAIQRLRRFGTHQNKGQSRLF